MILRLVMLSCLGLMLVSCQYINSAVDHNPISLPFSQHNLPDMGGRELKIGVDRFSPPYNYIKAETKTDQGWDYDVWCTLCQRLNCEPVFVQTPWSTLLHQVEQGALDVGTGGITMTDERAKVVQFSNAYITVQERLIGRVGDDRFHDYLEFMDNSLLRLGVISQTTSYDTALTLTADQNWRLESYHTPIELVEALITNKIDGFIWEEVGGQPYRGPHYKRVEFVGPPIQSSHLGFIYPLDNDFAHTIDLALDSMRFDKTLMTFHQKYLSKEFILTVDDILWETQSGEELPPLPTCADVMQ